MDRNEIIKNIILVCKNLVSLQTLLVFADSNKTNIMYKSTVYDVLKQLLIEYIKEFKNETQIKVNVSGTEYVFDFIVWLNNIKVLSHYVEKNVDIDNSLSLSELSKKVLESYLQVTERKYQLETFLLDFQHDIAFLKYIVKPSITQAVFKQMCICDFYDVNEYIRLYKSCIAQCFLIDVNNIPSIVTNNLEDINLSIRDDILVINEYSIHDVLKKINFSSYNTKYENDIVLNEIDVIKDIIKILKEFELSESTISSSIYKLLMFFSKKEILDIFDSVGKSKKALLLCCSLQNISSSSKDDVLDLIKNIKEDKYVVFRYGYSYLIYNRKKLSDITSLDINRRPLIIAELSEIRNIIYENDYFTVFDKPNTFKISYCSKYDIISSIEKFLFAYSIEVDYVELVKSILQETENIFRTNNLFLILNIISLTDLDQVYVDDNFLIKYYPKTLETLNSVYASSLLEDILAIVFSFVDFKNIQTKYTYNDKSRTFSEIISFYSKKTNKINKLFLESIHELCKFIDNNNYLSPNVLSLYSFIYEDTKESLETAFSNMYYNKQYIKDTLLRKLDMIT